MAIFNWIIKLVSFSKVDLSLDPGGGMVWEGVGRQGKTIFT